MPLDVETEWMLRFQAGEEDGFLAIVKRYEKPLINFAYKYVGDQATAEDVAQDVFVDIYKQAKTYKPTGKFSTWIFTMAAHRCLNIKRSNRKYVELFDLPEEKESDQLGRNEEVNVVRKALLELPGQQRAAMILAKFEEMALSEIAVVLKTSEGGVKQLLQRAKKTLSQKLKPYL